MHLHYSQYGRQLAAELRSTLQAKESLARGVSMQFGRFHGIALLMLGVLLLAVQTVVIFRAPADTKAPSQQPATAPAQPAETPFHGAQYFTGVIGTVLAGAGALVLAQASRKGKQEYLEEERREEDRSFGPEGHHVSTPTIWKER